MLPREAAQLVETLARAVQATHASGVIHRDLKPSNVLLAADGSPKIADFGLAKMQNDAIGQTQEGSVLGTPCYMAPEQASGRNEDVGPHADIYALGAILYELLTGRPPFKAGTWRDTVLQVISAEPTPPSRAVPNLPHDLERVCLVCLAKNPSDRYACADELADDLVRWRQGRPVRAHPATVRYLAGKYARRHRWAILLTGLFALALIGSVIAARYVTKTHRDVNAAALPAPEKSDANQDTSGAEGAAQPLGERNLIVSGWSRRLIDRSLKGWGTRGAWASKKDDKGNAAITGTGMAEGRVPVWADGDERLKHYKLQIVFKLHEAQAVELHFGEKLTPVQKGRKFVLRVTKKHVSLSRQEPGETERMQPVVDTLALQTDPDQEQVIWLERQEQAWWVFVGSGQEHLVGGIPHSQTDDERGFCLAADDGFAWFSDVIVEELVSPASKSDGK